MKHHTIQIVCRLFKIDEKTWRYESRTYRRFSENKHELVSVNYVGSTFHRTQKGEAQHIRWCDPTTFEFIWLTKTKKSK